MVISQNGPVTTDLSGILGCIVQQPSEPSFSNSGDKYQEIWKGPYSLLKDIGTSEIYGIRLRAGSIRPNIESASNWIQRYSVPSLNAGWSWYIDGFKVSEQTAGDHAILQIDYYASDGSGGGGSGSSGENNDYAESWNVQWQSYTQPVFGFCKDDPNDLCCAHTKNIMDFIRCPTSQKDLLSGTYTLNVGGQQTKMQLNSHEISVVKKYENKLAPVYHYPIVTHTTQKNYSVSVSMDMADYPDTGDYIDEMNEPICPFDIEGSWQWVKVGDNVTLDYTGSKDVQGVFVNIGAKHLRFTRTEIWWGMLSADPNFYGGQKPGGSDINGRWGLDSI